MKSDTDLLRSFVQDHSGEAFTEVVRRNAGFVHSCVLRRVGGDSQMAEDITQKVFSDLARKAPSLAKLTSVSGWLYVSANLASAEIVRKERRRKAREAAASHMQEILAPEGAQTCEKWSRIRDLLDDLICGLCQSDREAVVLRYFSKRTYLEIAAVQGTTDEGARKQVKRAIEKLRLKLAKSGVTSSMEALESVLAKQQDAKEPKKLADRVAGIALVEFGATGAATSWLLSLVRVLASRTATMGAVFVASSVLIAWQHHKNVLLQTQLDRRHEQAEQVLRLEKDNRLLARKIAEAEDLGRKLAITTFRPGSASATGAPNRVRTPLNIKVTSEGQIGWENEHVTLEEFLNRLVAFHAQDPASEAQFIVNGDPAAAVSATAYVVEQASKAGFHDIVINSPTSPSTTDNWLSVAPAPLHAGDVTPPMLPDVPVKP
jgi:RNA polymerase sigma factor (sigma-70 family)